MELTDASKPFLRWAGSKRKLIIQLKEYWNPSFNRYFEPFMGSAQLFFAIDDARDYIISDKNHELIETYLQIKNNPYGVYKILKEFKNTEESYYQIRSIKTSSLGVNQRAARFIYLNWLCFNGIYRTNLKGQFNVPYSHNTRKDINNWPLLKLASKKLQNALIVEGDFETVIKNHLRQNDFVYLDPPYALENTRIFNQYGNHTFGLNDVERLKEILDFINTKKSKFLLSYASSDDIKKMFSKWKVKEISVQRNIAGFTEHRRLSKEVLITNI